MADGAAQRRDARAQLLHRTRAGDRRGDGQRAGAVEDKSRIIRDGARAERASGAAGADPQRAAGNRRGAGGGIGAAERNRAAGRIDREHARARDRSTQGRAQSREDEGAGAGGGESMQGAASRSVAPRGDRAASTRGRAEITDDDDAGATVAAHGHLIIRRTRAATATTSIGRTCARAHIDKIGRTGATAAETTETGCARTSRMDTATTTTTVISVGSGDGGKKSDAAVTRVGRRITTDAAGAAATAALEAAGANAITKSARKSLGTRRRSPTR